MKVLIWGGEARYRADLPHAVQSLPLELVFCPREQPPGVHVSPARRHRLSLC